MLFLPVTRPWALPYVVEAFDASDIPKEVILYLDAPGCRDWIRAFNDRGWVVMWHESGRGEPPKGRVERRHRHYLMRRDSQSLVEMFDNAPILFSEDDTLVPSDVWSRLTPHLATHTAASGVQRSRLGTDGLGVWRYNADAGCLDPYFPFDHRLTGEVVDASACGHYCLLTTARSYADAAILDPDESIDRQHTLQLRPVAVDTGVPCGHLINPEGTVVLP